MLKKVYLVVISIAVAAFILTAAIACPILIRGFYYSQIGALDIVEKSGYSEEVIREAFDEMMDYCTNGGPASGLEFGTGVLKWSEEGKDHFDDVAKLFSLDLYVLKISGVLLIIYGLNRLVERRAVKVGEESSEANGSLANVSLANVSLANGSLANNRAPSPWLGPFFWGPAGLLLAILVAGIGVAVDFDGLFVKFHHAFFPGKDNWLFDPAVDEIIKILPEEFFRNCAVLIISVIVVLCVASIALSLKARRKSNI